MIRKFLFPKPSEETLFSLFLLALRLLLGTLLMLHGVDKLIDYALLSDNFPDPIGMGSQISLIQVIFAELFCAAAFLLGLLYRLALIPMIIAMAVAFFSFPQATLAEGELAFLYLLLFIMLYISGPGKYSIDYLIYSATEPIDFTEEA